MEHVSPLQLHIIAPLPLGLLAIKLDVEDAVNILRFDTFYSYSKRRSETIRISGPVFCAAVDNFGAMAPEIGLLARLNIQLLFCDRTF